MFKKNSNFLMNFEVYKGLKDYISGEQKKSMIASGFGSEIEDSLGAKEKSITNSLTSSQNPTEHDKMKDFNCDLRWPVCLYDFSFKNRVP